MSSKNTVQYPSNAEFARQREPAPKKQHVSNILLPHVCSQVLRGHKGNINTVKFTRNCEYCFSGGSDKSVRLWNPQKGMLLKEFVGHGYDVFDIDVMDDNSKFASAGADKQILLWDIASEGQIVRKLRDHNGRINSIMFSPDCQLLASASYDKTVKLWDMRSRNVFPMQTLDDFTDSVSSVFIQGEQIVTSCIDGCLRIYDVRVGKLMVDNIGHPTVDARLTSDAKCVSLSCLDNKVRLLDKVSGELLNTYTGHVSKAYKIQHCISNDDHHLVSGSEDGNIYFWDIVDGKVVQKLSGHSGPVNCLAYHKSLPFLITGSFDGTVRVWTRAKATE